MSDDTREQAQPTEREVKLARAVLALARALESPDPDTWEVTPAAWGDGRTTYEVHGKDFYTVDGARRHTTPLICQFRPDDIDGSESLAEACVMSARVGVALAREVLGS